MNLAKEHTTPISQHVFLYPFLIKYWNAKPDDDNKKKSKWKDIFRSLQADGWSDEPTYSPFSSPENYSEYAYFHEYVHKAMFNDYQQKEKGLINENGDPNFISYQLYRLFKKGTFDLHIRMRGQKAEDDITYHYELVIEDISLRLYN